MAMTVSVLLAIIQINYVSSDRVVRTLAVGLVERFRNDAVQDITRDLGALKSLIGIAAELGRQDPGVYEDDRALG
jgi:adenylate cyclase